MPNTNKNDRLLDQFTKGYVEAMLFAEVCDEDGAQKDEPLDANFCWNDFSSDDKAAIADDCRAFFNENAADLRKAIGSVGYSAARAGADFWFTRQGHGVGYWDRPELPTDLADRLTTAADQFGAHDDGPTVFEGKVCYGRSRAQNEKLKSAKKSAPPPPGRR